MELAKYESVLWDIPKDTVHLDEQFVIKRVLTFGGVFLIRDLIHSLGLGPVQAAFKAMKPTEMPLRKYHFFKNVLFV